MTLTLIWKNNIRNRLRYKLLHEFKGGQYIIEFDVVFENKRPLFKKVVHHYMKCDMTILYRISAVEEYYYGNGIMVY